MGGGKDGCCKNCYVYKCKAKIKPLICLSRIYNFQNFVLYMKLYII